MARHNRAWTKRVPIGDIQLTLVSLSVLLLKVDLFYRGARKLSTDILTKYDKVFQH